LGFFGFHVNFPEGKLGFFIETSRCSKNSPGKIQPLSEVVGAKVTEKGKR